MTARLCRNILALDLGNNCGFAHGGGPAPTSGTWILGKTGDPNGQRYNRLVTALQILLQQGSIDLIVKEQNLSLAIANKFKRNQGSITLTAGLHAMVDLIGARYAVPVENVAPSTARKHFIGTGGHIENVKEVVLRRAIMLGYVPRECTDTDRGDAVCMWDWALSLYGGKAAVYNLSG